MSPLCRGHHECDLWCVLVLPTSGVGLVWVGTPAKIAPFWCLIHWLWHVCTECGTTQGHAPILYMKHLVKYLALPTKHPCLPCAGVVSRIEVTAYVHGSTELLGEA